MEIIPGKRKDSYLHVYEGYTYHTDKRYTHIYRCAKRNTTACRGLLIKENEKFILESNHNHPNEPYVFDVLNLKNEMIRMCKETTIPNKEIFDTVSRKNPKAAAYVSYNSMRNILSKEKLKMRPPLPSSVHDLDNLFQDYEPVKFIYKGCAISEDNKYSYMFTSNKLLKILEKSSEIFIDGTFSIVPRTPNFAQLFSVHVRYMDKGIAVLFILCEARTQLVYESIWKEVIKLAPDLQSNLRFIMCDYEKASMNAVHKQFPQASLRGCWFHYCQAVLKKWKQLGLLKAPRKVVSMAMTLALAPPDMFSEGLNLMQIIADEESDNYPNILLFMRYMRSTWLPISKKISVYGCPVRTNNLVESFHNIMSQKMQTVHPNLWIFLDKVSKLITDQEINYDRLVNGLQVSRNRCPFNKYRNAKMQEVQNYLSTGIYSLKEFLQVFDEDIERQQYNMLLSIDDNDEHEIYADLHTEGAIEVTRIDIAQQNIRRRKRRRRCNYDSNESEAATVEVDQTSEPVENNNNNDEDCIYEVPYDDYSYWNNLETSEEDKKETPFLSINGMDLTLSRNNSYEEGTCMICLIEKSKIAFIPCGHLCCCKNCVQKLFQEKCPACNNNYEKYIPIITP